MRMLKPRILIVEDEQNWRDVLSEALAEHCDVETAGTLREAQRKLRERLFDVVSIDISLTAGDRRDEQGMRLFSLIRDLGEFTKTIVVTGYPTIKTAKEALQGFESADYLLKWPEDGKAFDPLEYRDIVLKAAEGAGIARERAARGNTLAAIPNLVVDKMVDALSSQTGRLTRVQRREWTFEVGALVTRLFTKLEPVIPHPSDARTIQGGHGGTLIEATYWSRALGKAVLVRLGDKEEMALLGHEAGEEEALTASTPRLRGVAVPLDDMGFGEFADPPTDGG